MLCLFIPRWSARTSQGQEETDCECLTCDLVFAVCCCCCHDEYIRWCLRAVGGRYPKEMRNSTRLSLSWNTSVMSLSVVSSKYRWRSAAYFRQKRSKRSAVSSPVPQWGQIGDVICPVKAWYEAVDVSLLSLSWLIVLCACHGTPGGILELSWPSQHLKCQMAVPVGLFWAVFSNSSCHDRTVNCCKCWNAHPMSVSASDWFRRPPSFATLSPFPSTLACPGTHSKWTTFSVFLSVIATSFPQILQPYCCVNSITALSVIVMSWWHWCVISGLCVMCMQLS